MLTAGIQIQHKARAQLSLGKALAILRSEKENASAGPNRLDEQSKVYLEHLHNRFVWLTSELNRLVELERSIPTTSCTGEECTLENHEDFFIAYLMECFPPYVKNEDNLCARLIRHLNDCYPCFCIYANVMRDFYHEIGQVGLVKGER